MKIAGHSSYKKALRCVILMGTVLTVGSIIGSVGAADTANTTNIADKISSTGSVLNTAGNSNGGVNTMDSLNFENLTYETRTMSVDGKEITFRAYENVPYVSNPVDTTYQSMNIYIPEAYFHQEKDGKYTADTAPIFLPNSVGGYRPGKAATPTVSKSGEPNAVLYALSRGLVVAAPAARGRSNETDEGVYYGKAPAAIVDLKAAAAYLHKNDAIMPGDANRIISNGTSAGGALSLLLGASGNSADYAPYLSAIGAADTRNDIFAVSAYCPITDLDHADMAYEWSYNGVNSYTGMPSFGGQMEPPDPSLGSEVMPMPGPQQGGETTVLTDDDILYSSMLKNNFPMYVNSLNLKDGKGQSLTMDYKGEGSFMNYAKSFIIDSADKAKASGTDISGASYLIYDTKNPQKIVDVDWAAYNKAVGRMKAPGAFDARNNSTGENNLFGTATVDNQHFTQFASAYGDGTSVADSHIVKMMNPLNYIKPNGTPEQSGQTQHWRIRYGEQDNNTSMAVPLIVATRLSNYGYDVDFSMPWGVGHSGDYDLKELFDWIDKVVAEK
ncbi:subtype B tannase [Veillonella sp.]|uniref:subtype B tannase n=1 Tax=Veillonella sp. TaxID=1926307 RepID=UPI0025F4D8C7|nr:subtype B tannase [Veillonella sp.]